MRIRYKLKRFLSLSISEKGLFIEALVTLGVMRAAILLFSFKRLTRHLRHSAEHPGPDGATPHQQEKAERIGKIIETAANNTPWESACLVQALTAQRMLKRRGIPGAFYLGAMKNGPEEPGIIAHAWTRCGNSIITGESKHEAFTVLSVFGWDKK